MRGLRATRTWRAPPSSSSTPARRWSARVRAAHAAACLGCCRAGRGGAGYLAGCPALLGCAPMCAHAPLPHDARPAAPPPVYRRRHAVRHAVRGGPQAPQLQRGDVRAAGQLCKPGGARCGGGRRWLSPPCHAPAAAFGAPMDGRLPAAAAHRPGLPLPLPSLRLPLPSLILAPCPRLLAAELERDSASMREVADEASSLAEGQQRIERMLQGAASEWRARPLIPPPRPAHPSLWHARHRPPAPRRPA